MLIGRKNEQQGRHNEYWNIVQNEVTMDDLFGNSHHI